MTFLPLIFVLPLTVVYRDSFTLFDIFPNPCEMLHVREAAGTYLSWTLTDTHLGSAEQESILFHSRP